MGRIVIQICLDFRENFRGQSGQNFQYDEEQVCLPMIILVVYRMHLILGQNLYTHIIFMPLLFSK